MGTGWDGLLVLSCPSVGLRNGNKMGGAPCQRSSLCWTKEWEQDWIGSLSKVVLVLE